jgi:hypothetical protein
MFFLCIATVIICSMWLNFEGVGGNGVDGITQAF